MKRDTQLERLYPDLHRLIVHARVPPPLPDGVRERLLARAIALIATPSDGLSLPARRGRGRA